MKNKILTCLGLFIISMTAFSQDTQVETPIKAKDAIGKMAKSGKVKFIKTRIIIYKKDTLAKILRRFVKEDSIINKSTPMVQKTLESNPHIKNWRSLKAGESIFLYLNPSFLDLNKMKNFRSEVKRSSQTIQKNLDKKKISVKKKQWSTFYMASLGSFSQNNDTLAKVNFKQNSPVTLGVMHTYYPKKGNYTISTSTYLSYLMAASTNLASGDVAVPMEVGFNSYYNKPFGNASHTVYGGFDFEKFSTFNLAGIETAGTVGFDQNYVGFLTIGYSKLFKLKKRTFVFKTSLSQSVFSSRTVAYSGDTSTNGYTGQKFMFFLLTPIAKNFFLSSLVKYHLLSGPSTVSSLRVGVGAGYFF